MSFKESKNKEGVSRQDILAAYEMILGRSPESESVFALHSVHHDRFELGRAFLGTDEFRLKFPLQNSEQHFPGYKPNEIQLLHKLGSFKGPGAAGFCTNFLGVRFRSNFFAGYAPYDGHVTGVPAPIGDLQGETAEWIGVMKAVLGAKDRWRVLELGAGYGTWMTNSGKAAQLKNIQDIRLYGVEGDAGHAKFMLQHLGDNGFDPSDHVVLHGVVGPVDGTAVWADASEPEKVYGGRPLGPGGIDYHGHVYSQQTSVRMYGIRELLEREPIWDLVHMDIQGGEGNVCEAARDIMSERVRWVFVGTHSRAFDGEVMTIFHAAGWELENEKPTIMPWLSRAPTLETMATVDGLQVWRNPRLASAVG